MQIVRERYLIAYHRLQLAWLLGMPQEDEAAYMSASEALRGYDEDRFWDADREMSVSALEAERQVQRMEAELAAIPMQPVIDFIHRTLPSD